MTFLGGAGDYCRRVAGGWYNERMARLEAEKAIIALLTNLFFGLAGVVVLIVGGLVSLYISPNQHTRFLLWSGSIIVLIFSAVCFVFIQYIRKHIKELEKL